VENNNRDTLNHINKIGTHNACELACSLNVKRFIYLSSVAVVSGNSNIPLIEDLAYSATNKYGQSKIEAEKTVLEYRNKGVPTVILRPPMVYGPDEPHMMGTLLKLLKHRLLPTINNGKNHLHMIYIENLVEALVFCLNNDEFLSGTFFVADKEVLTVKELYQQLANGLGTKSPWNLPSWLANILLKTPVIGPKLKFIIKDRVYSTKKIESLGFEPPYSAYQALEESARNFIYQS
jgi:nucleoside-diphosphate-sugar epimerase